MTQNNIYTEPPPLSSDIPLRIYSNPICPFVQRVRLLAAAKGVRTEEINIHLKVKPQWYLDKINPYGQVPTIEHNGHLIRESLIAFDYIDEVFGDESVWPSDPFRKAHARLFIDDFGKKFIPNYYKHYGGKFEESHTKEVVDFIEKMEKGLKLHGEAGKGKKPVLGGIDGKPMAVDYIVWPWLERLEALSILEPKIGSSITKEKFPLFFDYIDRMKQNEAVKQSYLPPEAHAAFIKGMVNNDGYQDYSTVDIHGTGVTIYTKKE